jgi:uncharacterized integral membrane protein
VEQYNIGWKVNYRQALEKIHVNTETWTKNKQANKQTNNEVIIISIIVIIIIIIIIIIITVVAYYKKWLRWTFQAPNTSTSLQTTLAADAYNKYAIISIESYFYVELQKRNKHPTEHQVKLILTWNCSQLSVSYKLIPSFELNGIPKRNMGSQIMKDIHNLISG